MEVEEPTQVEEYIQKQLALNKAKLAKQDSSFTVTSRLHQEREAEDNKEVLYVEDRMADDAIEYVQLVKSLFTAKATRNSGKRREPEAEKHLRAAAIESLTESAHQGDIEDSREDGAVQGKLKKQLSMKLQEDKMKI